jgi:biotin carboxylase
MTNGEQAPTIFCVSTYVKGEAFMREVARLGCRVMLLTAEKHRDAAEWPRDVLAEIFTMPENLSTAQVINTVTYLARSRRIARIAALDEFDMETVAALREHMRIPGMGLSTTLYFRDKLAMRTQAQLSGIRVPEFTSVINYDDLRRWMSRVPAPWLLKPRTEASAIGIRKMHEPEQVWRALDELGDRQSHFVLERFVRGVIFHVDGVVNDRQTLLAAVHQYGQPPMQTMHEGGVFTTRSVERGSAAAVALSAMHQRLVVAMGLVRGVTHAEFIRGLADNEFYFLEVAARVGGAFIADVVEQSLGVNPWVEWARIEVANLRGETYRLPELRDEYAGSVLCLARVPDPDLSQYDAPEVVHRMKKHHHAGLIVRSPDSKRVESLLDDYSRRFAQDFVAVQPAPDKPTA